MASATYQSQKNLHHQQTKVCVWKYADLRHVPVWAQKSVELVEPVCKQGWTDMGSSSAVDQILDLLP